MARHFFWSSFKIGQYDDVVALNIKKNEVKDLQIMHGYDLKGYVIENKRQVLRNCVEPKLGQYIMDCAMNVRRSKNTMQHSLFSFGEEKK